MGLIQDIKKQESVPAYLRGFGQSVVARELKTEVMIEELYKRGISIETIFGQFYAMESNATGLEWQYAGNGEDGQHGKPKPLTVRDVELAGLKNKEEVNDKPF